MRTQRLEAFSDGVIAIIITIMVLELDAPATSDWHGLGEVGPHLLTYLLSFVLLGIYWNNHHHMLHLAERANGAILWANLHLLFWLSLVPFVTAWMGGSHAAALPTAAYGTVMICAAVAYQLLQKSIIRAHGPDGRLAQAIGRDRKGLISQLLYLAALPLAFVRPAISIGLYVTVALIWLVPDRRIERRLPHSDPSAAP